MTSPYDIFLKVLKDRYALTESRFQRILQIIINRATYNVQSETFPKVAILGAQPGAGKSEIQKIAETLMFRNAVICNADNFRDFHPNAIEIKEKYPDEYPIITAEYAQRWNNELCQYCRGKKLNYILETTFSSGEKLNDTIREIKLDGYKVEIMLLAVDPRLSLLGTHLRFEESVLLTDYGRKVSKHAHDSRLDAIPDTILSMQKAALYDDLYIYSRSVVLERSTLIEGATLIAHNPTNPLEVYLKEKNRIWPDKMEEYFQEKCSHILQLMKNRKASHKEIEEFKIHVGLAQEQQRKIKRGPKM